MLRDDLLTHRKTRDEASHAMMASLTGLQNYSKESQLVAICALFLFLCQHFKADATEILNVTDNMVRDSGSIPEWRAAVDYIRYEL